VQVYTGLVYQGPTLAKELVVGLREKLSQAGLTQISQAVGMQR
jgi:dihydroorotate dehydrogenase